MRTFFFDAEGRLNRARFWLGHLGIAGFLFVDAVVALALFAVPQIAGGKGLALSVVCYASALVLMLAAYGLALWASICLGIKRYQDRGKPGVWVLIQFAPVVGAIWYFIEAFCLPGAYGANQYGVDPLNPEVGSVAAAVEAARTAAGPPASSSRPGWVMPVLLVPAAMAFCLVVAALVMVGRTQSWLASATKVDGTVVALQPAGKDSDGKHEMYRAVVEAQTSHGRPIRVTNVWATYPAAELGSRTTLAYPTGEPNKAIVADFFNLYFLPTFLAGLGAVGVSFWLCVALLVKLLWKRQPSPHGFEPPVTA